MGRVFIIYLNSCLIVARLPHCVASWLATGQAELSTCIQVTVFFTLGGVISLVWMKILVPVNPKLEFEEINEDTCCIILGT